MKTKIEQKRDTQHIFIELLEFNAPKYFDFTNEKSFNLEDIDKWFETDHTKQQCVPQISTQQKITFFSKNNCQNDQEKFKEDETKLDELIKLHNEKIRKRKSCTLDKNNLIKFDHVIKKQKYSSDLFQERTSCSSNNTSFNISNNLLNFDNMMDQHKKKDNDKANFQAKLNSRIKDNLTKKTLQKAVITSSIIPQKINNNVFNETIRDNKLKQNKSNTRIQSSSVKLQLNESGKCSKSNFNTNKVVIPIKTYEPRSLTYCPRIYDSRTLKRWEFISKKDFYKLSPNSRHTANKEIAEMIRKNIL